MLSQQFLRAQNEVVDEGGGGLCSDDVAAYETGLWGYQEGAPFLVGMIMGRSTDDVLVAALDDEQMAILDAADEFYTVSLR